MTVAQWIIVGIAGELALGIAVGKWLARGERLERNPPVRHRR